MKYLSITFLFICSFLRAQLTGEIVGTAGSTDYGFSSVDLSTDAITTISSLGNRNASQGNSTYDKIHDIYFFKLGTVAIYKVDAQTGLVLDSIDNMISFSGIEYGEDCDCIYGIYYDNSANAVSLATVDFINKTPTTLGGVSFGPNIFGESGYDQLNHRYFRAGISTIEMLDNQGNLLDVLPSPGGLKNFEYDEINDRLIGIYFDASNNMIITSVDIISQQVTDLDTIPFTSSLLSGESTFDKVNQRYIFRSFNDLYIYDLQDRSVTSIADPFPGQMTGIEYKAPPVVVVTTGVPSLQKDGDVKIYPNPTKDYFTVKELEIGSNIKVFNAYGDKIYDIITEQRETQVKLQNQKPGIYFYELISNGKRETGKMIRD